MSTHEATYKVTFECEHALIVTYVQANDEDRAIWHAEATLRDELGIDLAKFDAYADEDVLV